MSQYNLTDFEWRVIKPLLPNTRYDKLAANVLAMVQLASMRLWLRAYESTA
jgi:transposase